MARSIAETTLLKARFFVEQASGTQPHDRVRLTNYLEAAIIFTRSVTLHLQKQFAGIPGFEEWYAKQQHQLRADPLSQFLLAQRNYVLKEGPVSVKRIIQLHLTESVHVSESVSVKVVSGKPWYKRSPRILGEDAL